MAGYPPHPRLCIGVLAALVVACGDGPGTPSVQGGDGGFPDAVEGFDTSQESDSPGLDVSDSVAGETDDLWFAEWSTPWDGADLYDAAVDLAPWDVFADDLAGDADAVDAPEWPVVLITEVMADNGGILEDGDGDTPDWLELYNPGPAPVSLDGWGLSDSSTTSYPWLLPDVTLVPGEFLLVFASGKVEPPADELHASFKLSSGGEGVWLFRPDGSIGDAVVFPPQFENISYGRAQDVTTTLLITDGTTARLAFEESTGWSVPSFDDTAWTEVVMGVGFDGLAAEAPAEDLALLQPTSQSSDGYGFTGVQAVDGELSTFSHTGNGDLTPWWSVALPGPSVVASIRLFNRVGCCPERLYNITVEILDADGAVVWTSEVLNPVADGETPTDPGEMLEVFPMAVGHAVRVSKVAVNGPMSSEWLSFAEVEVWGTPASPYHGLFNTDLEAAMQGQSASALLRIPCAGEPADRLTLTVQYDDGLVARLNDSLVFSGNALDGIAPGPASGEANVALDPALLTGDDLLALHGLNVDAADDDFLVRATLASQSITTGELAWFGEPTPGAPNGLGAAGFVAPPEVSVARGFFDAPFEVTLSSDLPGARIVYTLDGQRPTEDVGTVLEDPNGGPPSGTISVESTTTLKAAAFHDGWWPSRVVTHSYLFLAQVIAQPALPAGLPAVWDGINQPPVDADYEMDPEVVNDPAYTEDLLAGLRDIPTLSLVMDPDDLFGAAKGLYVHSQQRGADWERPTSVEFILPDGTTGFQEECGVRIHGYGWRPHKNTMKHSFRLEFRSQYGPSKLEYPLFPDAPDWVERFDSIVLRAQGSRSWQDFRDPEQAQYIRDMFARDTAHAMGKTDGHGIFVHLYLNGLYWGLYNPVERPDADFGEEYFGGDDSEYDAINRRTTTNEAIDGDLVAYNEMLAVADEGLATPEGYEAIQDYLDLVDLVDYMLIHQYTTNKDGPEIFSSNNMRGVRRREPEAWFRFFVWDMEYSIWNASDNFNIDVDVPGSISHVYAKLRENPDFRALYAERAAFHLTNGGALTAEAAAARWDARASQIERAIVAESARWGDTDREVPYTRDVEWEAERQRLMTEFFPYRTEILIQQLIDADLL